MITKENILAIPSKGRFKDETLDLLASAGIELNIPGRQLTSESVLPETGRFTVALMRPKDVIGLVGSGKISAGIVGLDTLEEVRQKRLSSDSWEMQQNKTLLRLGIGRCRLATIVPEKSDVQSMQDLDKLFSRNGALYIATSYPNITSRYFAEVGRRTKSGISTRYLSGSVETAITLGFANLITDLVETGATLRENGLREIGTIFESEAVLITTRLPDQNRISFAEAIRDRLAKVIP